MPRHALAYRNAESYDDETASKWQQRQERRENERARDRERGKHRALKTFVQNYFLDSEI